MRLAAKTPHPPPESPEREALIREAALRPRIHAQLWEKYDGNLPSDMNLARELKLNRSFSDDGAKDFIRQFKETIEFAKLYESDNIAPELTDTEIPEDDEVVATPINAKQSAAADYGNTVSGRSRRYWRCRPFSEHPILSEQVGCAYR